MSGTGSGYDQSVITYSPDGKVYQVEYAQKAVEISGTAMGIKCKDGIILATEKALASKMVVESSNRKVQPIDYHIGAVVTGLAADARQLILRAQDEARSWRTNFGEDVPPSALADRMGSLMHIFTSYWYLRPFGASIIMAGYDAEKKEPELYMSDPAGLSLRYHGVAIGKGTRAAKTEIEKQKFATKTCREALPAIAKILHTVHDTSNTKPFVLEMGWLCEESNWKVARVPADLVTAADEQAKREIDAEEMGSDDDDDDDDDE